MTLWAHLNMLSVYSSYSDDSVGALKYFQRYSSYSYDSVIGEFLRFIIFITAKSFHDRDLNPMPTVTGTIA
jgi:hypothetical protein